MKFFIIGDSGLLGQALVQEILSHPANEVLGVSSSSFSGTRFWVPLKGTYAHQRMDVIEEERLLEKLIHGRCPDVLINCAALVDLAYCEKNPQAAQRMHVDLPRRLSEVCLLEGIDFIQISSDQVFDGTQNRPYREDDKPNPVNVYGKTKLEGEEASAGGLIIRTNLVGFRDHPVKKTFAEWLCDALYHGEPITLFEDYVTSAMHVCDLSRCILELQKRKAKGIYHAAARDSASKYVFGEKMAGSLGLNFSQVKKGFMKEQSFYPVRPPYLALDVSRTEIFLNHRLPGVDDTIAGLKEQFQLRMKEKQSA
jgi:dTDP-4-dehydrorhamnose reductase